MSADTDGDRIAESEAVLETLYRWYHVPVLAAVIAFLLWTRTRAYDRFVRDGAVYFRGNDAYYHYRATMYSVENWPRRLSGDPWTNFPTGTNVGQFGTLLDQVVATVALIVGLGDPSSRQVAIVAVLTPAVLAALVTIPVYFLATRLSGSRIAGITAAVVLALVPQGAWVARSTVGFYDHHVAEALLMSVSMLAMVHALVVVRRERPVFEQVQDRDWDGLKPSLKASALAGLAVGLYLHTWPAGIVIAAIFGLFFVLAMVQAVLQDRSPEHMAFVAVTSMAVAAITILPWSLTLEAGATSLSLLQLLLLLGVGFGAAVLAWMAREWEDRELATESYPVAVAALGIVALLVMWLVLPEVLQSIRTSARSILFLGQSDTVLTISEAQSMLSDDRPGVGEQFWNGYGFTAFTALGAILWMGARAVLAKRPREEYMLIVVWTVFLLLMTLTQIRFHYYLVLAVAVLNGWLVVQVARLAAFPSLADLEDVKTYHVLTVLAVIAILVVPIAGPIAVSTSAEQAERTGPGSVVYWDDNLDWMSENTPEPGTYGGEDNAMSYYGPFDDVSDYEYPPGAYGVMSWWDYGHWITVEGERIPNANPFQQGPRASSAFLQETNETRANMYLEALPSDSVSGGELYGMSNESLREAVNSLSEQEAGEDTRYVMIDDQMVGTKFGAIAEWTGPGGGSYVGTEQLRSGNQTINLAARNDQYYDTMMSRMYYADGSMAEGGAVEALSHYRLVYESPTRSSIVSIAQRTRDGGLQSTGLVGWDIGTLQSRYPGIVQSINTQGGQFVPYDIHQESAIKTYERVEGATITGEATPNMTVRAAVPLETNTGRDFTYVNDAQVGADGEFEITVPYSTNNALGPEDGYTNTSVVANGTYTIVAGQPINFGGQSQIVPTESAENVTVPETAIYEGQRIEVDMETVEAPNGSDGNDSTSGSASGSMTSANSTSDATASGSAGSAAGTDAGAGSVATASAPTIFDGAASLFDARTLLAGVADALAAAVRSLAEPIAAPTAG